MERDGDMMELAPGGVGFGGSAGVDDDGGADGVNSGAGVDVGLDAMSMTVWSALALALALALMTVSPPYRWAMVCPATGPE